MTRTVILHISGNRYAPLPNRHHTLHIWEELSKGSDEYHVFARNKSFAFSTTQLGNIHLHLVPSLSNRMFEFMVTSWFVLFHIIRLRPTHLVAQCPVMGGIPAALGSRLFKIPLLVELHGPQYFHAIRKGFAGWFEHWLYKTFSFFSLRAATRIRSLSKDMTFHLYASHGPIVAAKAIVVPTRVNTDIFSNRRASYHTDGELKIITVGSLSHRKNHAALISALAHALIDFQLTIIGEGPERGPLSDLIKQLGLTARVRLTGNMNHEALAHELNTHDVYVHYAKGEGLARAILEAMACGCPVVTTRVGFIEGILEDRVNSLVIDQPWDEQLRKSLVELRDSELLRRTIGLAGLATIQASFDAAKVFQAYRELIHSMSVKLVVSQ